MQLCARNAVANKQGKSKHTGRNDGMIRVEFTRNCSDFPRQKRWAGGRAFSSGEQILNSSFERSKGRRRRGCPGEVIQVKSWPQTISFLCRLSASEAPFQPLFHSSPCNISWELIKAAVALDHTCVLSHIYVYICREIRERICLRERISESNRVRVPPASNQLRFIY